MPHFTMNQLHSCISSLVLLLSLTVYRCTATTIYGFEGQDVTLPCKYDSGYHGVCDVCWMKGSIPRNGCGDQIIYATEKGVVIRSSVRYQLYGNLRRGDATLTIHNARKSDSGKYGCRVHVPGWFNDKKFEVNLAIREAKPQTSTRRYVTTTTHIPTQAPVLTTKHVTTPFPEQLTTKPTEPVLTTQYVTTTFPETTKPTETLQTNSTTLGYMTATPLVPTQGPVSTITDKTTSSPVTTKPADSQSTSCSLGHVTTTTHIHSHGPDSTKKHETTSSPENLTTKPTVAITENDPDQSPRKNKSVKDVLVILVPVILILLVLGTALFLISKYNRRLRSTLEIAKNSSAFVSYSNLDNSVTLPMTNTPNN
ncbi:T-cell immunoglobulin and mucin domain-containing protein 4-like isoform X2 [Hemibagrus wyckioides]|uniref:T-cell immunoglobulin and mucin domain-containing protein 4-like isoform X2 n=1 Tax=Hemibagrus wyckioides TaxID=337641 RepID=UPI00266DA931|nr:T-cell immunoglobulin and mucin domain-containing protein 4-like isoform X2 [Hemibagrus wyckioides]